MSSDVAGAALAHAREHLQQLAPTVGVHPWHQRRIAEVKHPRIAQPFIGHVPGAEGLVHARAVEKAAIDPRWTDDDRVARGLPDGHPDVVGEARLRE